MLTQLLMHDWFAIDWIALYCYLLPDSSTKDHLKQNRNQTCVYCRTGLKSKIFVARLYQLFHYKKKQEAVAHSVNRSQNGCCAPAAAAQSSWISPVCWLWQTDSRLVKRNALRSLDRLTASPCSAHSSFLCLLHQLCLMCTLLKWSHTHSAVFSSVCREMTLLRPHTWQPSLPPSRPSAKGNCL